MKLIHACLWVISFPFYNIFYITLHNLQNIISCDILDTWCNRYLTYLLLIFCGDNHYIWTIFPSSKLRIWTFFCQQNLFSFNFWFYPLFLAFIEFSVFFPSSASVEHLHLCLSSMFPLTGLCESVKGRGYIFSLSSWIPCSGLSTYMVYMNIVFKLGCVRKYGLLWQQAMYSPPFSFSRSQYLLLKEWM